MGWHTAGITNATAQAFLPPLPLPLAPLYLLNKFILHLIALPPTAYTGGGHVFFLVSNKC